MIRRSNVGALHFAALSFMYTTKHMSYEQRKDGVNNDESKVSNKNNFKIYKIKKTNITYLDLNGISLLPTLDACRYPLQELVQ